MRNSRSLLKPLNCTYAAKTLRCRGRISVLESRILKLGRAWSEWLNVYNKFYMHRIHEKIDAFEHSDKEMMMEKCEGG